MHHQTFLRRLPQKFEVEIGEVIPVPAITGHRLAEDSLLLRRQAFEPRPIGQYQRREKAVPREAVVGCKLGHPTGHE